MELFHKIKTQDTVAFLDSELKRKFITISIIDHFAYQLKELSFEKLKRSVIIVPDISWFEKQAKDIRNHTDLKVELFYTENSDYESEEYWKQKFISNEVFIMTCSLFYEFLSKSWLTFAQINLLIINEAHLVLNNDKYQNVAKLFTSTKTVKPRLVAFVASLIDTDESSHVIEKVIQKMENALSATRDTLLDLNSFCKGDYKTRCEVEVHPEKTFTFFASNISMLKMMESFISFVDNAFSKLPKKLQNNPTRIKGCLIDIFEVMKTMGYWCAEKLVDMYIQECAEISYKFYSANMILSNLLSAQMTLLYFINNNLKENYCLDDDNLNKHIPIKLKIILKNLLNYRPSPQTDEESNKGPNLCAIIFAKKRSVVRLIHLWLKTQIENDKASLGFLKIDFLIGGHTKRAVNSCPLSMITRHQEEALARFKRHETNVLIVTANLESEIDIPKCNLVIRYDFPERFIEYLYSKNRIRVENGLYILMIPNTQSNGVNPFMQKLKDYYKKENLLRNTNASTEALADSDLDLCITEDELIPSYFSTDNPNGPKACLSNSLSILNRYCFKLPSDSFTKLTPLFKYVTNQEKLIQCTVTLPINSPLREPISGHFMKTKTLSMKSAALEACKRLHKCHELNDNFLPYGKESNKYIAELGLDINELKGEGESKRTNDQNRPVTSKRRQCFNKRVATVLQGASPNKNSKCNLYAFILKLTCPIPEEQNTRGRKLFDPSQTPRCFALLTCNFVPKICDFPLFIRSGEVLVTMKEIAKDLMFTEDELEHISNFHYFIFHDLLRLDKSPMKFDLKTAPSSYFILPVNVDSNFDLSTKEVIDWEFMKKVDEYEKEDKSLEKFKNRSEPFVFKKEIYEDAVVKPWYRQYEAQAHYYVADICEHMTPQTRFPDGVHNTFLSYYQEKYDLVLNDINQPLLDVDHTSARLNLLTPRFVNRKGVTLPMSSQKTKKEKRENLQQKQLLIPELCIVHPFPASFWRKAVCVPCILYRVNSLLVAEELRQEVSRSIGIGPLSLPSNQNWPPLDFGWTLSDVVAQSNLDKPKFEKDSLPDETTFDNIEDKNLYETSQNNDINHALIIDDFDSTLYNEYCLTNYDPFAFACKDFSECNMEDEIDDNYSDFSPSPPVDLPFMYWPLSKDDRIQIKELDGDELEKEPIRVGSPSNFEILNSRRGPLNTIYDIGVPGLESISAPVNLNLQGLSEDLANIQQFRNLDDNESEEEIIFDPELDDETAGFDSSTANSTEKYKHEVKKSKSEEFYNEIIEWGLMVQSLNESPKRKIKSIFDEIDGSNLHLETSDTSDEEVTTTDLFAQKFFIKFNKEEQLVENKMKEGEDLDVNKVVSNLKSNITIKTENQTSNLDLNDNKTKKEEAEKIVPATVTQNRPHFGELLPNRDEIVKEKEAQVEINTMSCDVYDDEKFRLGPSPSVILQALTTSNAGDGINLERLETVGDSFLKYAVTVYNYSMCPDIHEGRLSYLRSLQISNHNLYRLGQKKCLGELMISTKFEPNDNWLPPGFTIPEGSDLTYVEPTNYKNYIEEDDDDYDDEEMFKNIIKKDNEKSNLLYSLVTQHSLPDKSIADAVEALIGAYLIHASPKGALLFMKWLGLKVMPENVNFESQNNDGLWNWLPKVKSSLLFSDKQDELMKLYKSYNLNRFENEIIKYQFKDKSFLIQAFTHNSYCENMVTECYQRLEFLGDAVLDFLITRHLYDDPQQHSPGMLTDLRSALVNNTFFASLAVKYEFQKYIKVLSPDLIKVNSEFIEKFTANGFRISVDECNLMMTEGECDQLEDVEVPKALGDIFESVAGAIYLDSGLSLDAVWRVYYRMMKPEIEYFSKNIPKSPVRELLELKPQKVLFSKPESIPGRKVRIICEVFGEGKYIGIGRNKRLAKSTAAKKALKHIKLKQN